MNAELSARTILDVTQSLKQYAELRTDVLECAMRYSGLRSKWYLSDEESRRSLDAERSRAHDVFIDSLNILSRAMARHGDSNGWRADIGSERRHIGDVACYLSLFMSLAAR